MLGAALEHFRAFGSILEAFGSIRKHPKHLPFTTRITSFFENLKSEPDIKAAARAGAGGSPEGILP
jgi:hypothetical protein